MWDAIDGQRSGLEKTYVAVSAELAQFARHGSALYKVSPREPHPLTRSTLLWLEHMVPGATKLAEYRLLAFPLPTVRREGAVGGRAKRDREIRTAAAVYAAICAVVCFVGVMASGGSGWVLGSGALTGALTVGSLWFHGQGDQARAVAHAFLFRPAHRHLGATACCRHPVARRPRQRLWGCCQRRRRVLVSERVFWAGWESWRAWGCAGMMALVVLVVLVAIFGRPPPERAHWSGHIVADGRPEQYPEQYPDRYPGQYGYTCPVRRAIPVSVATPPSALPATSPSSPPAAAASTAATVLYEVTGIAAGDTLNVRNGPGATHEISARLPGGYRDIQVIGSPVVQRSDAVGADQVRRAHRLGDKTLPAARMSAGPSAPRPSPRRCICRESIALS